MLYLNSQQTHWNPGLRSLVLGLMVSLASLLGLLSGQSLFSQETRDRDSGIGPDNARLAVPGNVSGQAFGARGTNQQAGVVITNVIPGSPAQVAGIEVRDTVLTVNGYQVGIVNGVTYDLEREVMTRAGRGQPLTLLVRDWRTNNLTNVSVNLNAGGVTGGQINSMVNPVDTQLAQVRVWYDQYLQRPPSNSEMTAWRESLVRGNLTLDEVRAYLLGSADFYERFGRNNDVTFIYALYDKTQGRQPSQTELTQALALLGRYGSNRVAFVKEFLGGSYQVVNPGPSSLMTRELTAALTSYQKQLTPFVAWGFYGEQSSLVFKSAASIKLIEQYEIPGRENRREQQRLADEVLRNCSRLNELASQLRDRAERTNQYVREANRLRDDANQLQRMADQLLYQINQRR